MLYHYTTLETFIKILEGVMMYDNEYVLKFRASRVDQVNDPTEMTPDIKTLKDILHNKSEIKDIDKYLAYIDTVNESDFHDILNKEKQDRMPYVICFSEKRDYLPMWSLYGDKHHGICMCFDDDIIQETQKYYYEQHNNKMILTGGKVSYKRHWKSKVIHGIIETVLMPDSKDSGDELALLYLAAFPFIKNANYSYEHEHRICLYNFKKYSTPEINRMVKYDKEKPYIEVNIPLSALKGVILGTMVPFDFFKKSIETYLREKFNTKFKISKSKIPYGHE